MLQSAESIQQEYPNIPGAYQMNGEELQKKEVQNNSRETTVACEALSQERSVVQLRIGQPLYPTGTHGVL